METNYFLSFNIQSQQKEKKISKFIQVFAVQLINNTFGAPASLSNMENVKVLVEVPCHLFVNLSKEDPHQQVQRKYLICSRVKRKQVKASYFLKNMFLNMFYAINCFEYNLN